MPPTIDEKLNMITRNFQHAQKNLQKDSLAYLNLQAKTNQERIDAWNQEPDTHPNKNFSLQILNERKALLAKQLEDKKNVAQRFDNEFDNMIHTLRSSTTKLTSTAADNTKPKPVSFTPVQHASPPTVKHKIMEPLKSPLIYLDILGLIKDYDEKSQKRFKLGWSPTAGFQNRNKARNMQVEELYQELTVAANTVRENEAQIVLAKLVEIAFQIKKEPFTIRSDLAAKINKGIKMLLEQHPDFKNKSAAEIVTENPKIQSDEKLKAYGATLIEKIKNPPPKLMDRFKKKL